MPKVKVAYQTVKEIEVEVDEKYAGCIYFADAPWEEFVILCRSDIIWEKFVKEREKMCHEIKEKLCQEDHFFGHIVAITTENDNCIYED